MNEEVKFSQKLLGMFEKNVWGLWPIYIEFGGRYFCCRGISCIHEVFFFFPIWFLVLSFWFLWILKKLFDKYKPYFTIIQFIKNFLYLLSDFLTFQNTLSTAGSWRCLLKLFLRRFILCHKHLDIWSSSFKLTNAVKM